MATLQNIGKLKYRGKDGQWHPLPVVVQDAGGGVSTISGKGAPTSETQGKVNQLYRDEDTQWLYICVDAADGVYTWAPVSGGTGGASDWNGVSGKPFETVGEGLAVDSGKALRVSESVMKDIAGKVDKSTLQTAVDDALEEAKTSGAFDGADGKSAYEIAVEHGFTGTAEEWIASLKGADGVSPHIGENGNWWIGDTDTGVKAQGEKGDTGATGATGADGHTPVKGTDYFTDADKQEIAEAAAGMVDVPDKLPNPNALTFTGAVTGSYDGSAPLSVAIPSGSGGGGTDVALGMSGASVGQIAKITAVDGSGVPTAWEPVDLPSGGGGNELRRIKIVTLTEDASFIEISTDDNGNSFELSEFVFYISGKSMGVSGNVGLKINDTLAFYGPELSNTNTTSDLNTTCHALLFGVWQYTYKSTFNASQSYYAYIGVNGNLTKEKMKKFRYGATASATVGFKAGTILELWGR